MSRPGALRRLAVALTLLAAHPGVALACATCTDPKEASRGAFIGVTLFLSLLPLAFIGSVGAYIYWRVQKREAAFSPGPPALPFPHPGRR